MCEKITYDARNSNRPCLRWYIECHKLDNNERHTKRTKNWIINFNVCELTAKEQLEGNEDIRNY